MLTGIGRVLHEQSGAKVLEWGLLCSVIAGVCATGVGEVRRSLARSPDWFACGFTSLWDENVRCTSDGSNDAAEADRDRAALNLRNVPQPTDSVFAGNASEARTEVDWDAVISQVTDESVAIADHEQSIVDELSNQLGGQVEKVVAPAVPVLFVLGESAASWLGGAAISKTAAWAAAVASGAFVGLWSSPLNDGSTSPNIDPETGVVSRHFPAEDRVEVAVPDDPSTPFNEAKRFDGERVGDRFVAPGYVNAKGQFVPHPVELGFVSTDDEFTPHPRPMGVNPQFAYLVPAYLHPRASTDAPRTERERYPIAEPPEPLPPYEAQLGDYDPNAGYEGHTMDVEVATQPVRTPATTMETRPWEGNQDSWVSQNEATDEDEPAEPRPVRDIARVENLGEIRMALIARLDLRRSERDRIREEYSKVDKLIEELGRRDVNDLDVLVRERGVSQEVVDATRAAGFDFVNKRFEIHTMTQQDLMAAGLDSGLAKKVYDVMQDHTIDSLRDLLDVEGMTDDLVALLEETVHVEPQIWPDPMDTYFRLQGVLHELDREQLESILYVHARAYGPELIDRVSEFIEENKPLVRLDQLDHLTEEMELTDSNPGPISFVFRDRGIWLRTPEGAEIDDHPRAPFAGNVNTMTFGDFVELEIEGLGKDEIEAIMNEYPRRGRAQIRSLDQLRGILSDTLISRMRDRGVWVRDPPSEDATVDETLNRRSIHRLSIRDMVEMGVAKPKAEAIFRYLRTYPIDFSDLDDLRRQVTEVPIGARTIEALRNHNVTHRRPRDTDDGEDEVGTGWTFGRRPRY